MRNQIVGLFVALLGIGAAACDGLEVSEEGGVETASGAWSAKEYAPPDKGHEGEEYLAWTVDFESQADIDALFDEQACGSEREGNYCPAVDPAKDALARAGHLTVCGPLTWREGRDCRRSHCQTCCTWIAGTGRVTCSTKCIDHIFC